MTATGRSKYVLDSYAVLAWLQGEPGGETVTSLLEQAGKGLTHLWISVVNLGEVLYIIEREESVQAAQKALGVIDNLPVAQAVVSREDALQAAHYKATYRMSYADCFALSLARRVSAVLVTGDPELLTQREVELLWVGK